MPELPYKADIILDFEVYCGTCKTGLCNHTTIRLSKKRKYPQIVVNVCHECMAKKNDKINELKELVGELKEEIKRLNKKLDGN